MYEISIPNKGVIKSSRVKSDLESDSHIKKIYKLKRERKYSHGRSNA